MKVVLDANVIASALIRPEGPPGRILILLIEGHRFELVISNQIMAEYRRCLFYPRVRRTITRTDQDIDLWLASLELIADKVEGRPATPVVARDPDDDIYIAATIEGKADFIVSGDSHLLDLKEYEEIHILNPRQFLDHLQRSAI